ncbi:acyl-CoA carboxylase subunit epsilon (plasmid) [Streptomyces sp. NBC_00464]|uniref:acyl-CoA carboxylase epsilon subunit n=1 Tax=unclassified Streptomyces TaxID=2593676 RepID=UPI002DD7A1E5|nr:MULTISPECIES: acyl-CoA carboxylase epsilon subunit [unclassified Streptomyces]WRZ87453.1 acyl-CoA carboxylase subunit epsilon [Streptomyces sp. NBC_01022]
MTPTETRRSTAAVVSAGTRTPMAIVVRGAPSREELAAVTAAVLALAQAAAGSGPVPAEPSRATWHRDRIPCTPVSWAALPRTP